MQIGCCCDIDVALRLMFGTEGEATPSSLESAQLMRFELGCTHKRVLKDITHAVSNASCSLTTIVGVGALLVLQWLNRIRIA